MKEEELEPNWFLRWEEELPSPEELMPLSQSLITPDLALALGIIPTSNSNSCQHSSPPRPPNLTTHSPAQTPSSQNHQSHHLGGGDYDLSEIGGGNSGGGGGGSGGGGGGEEQARTLKRPRLVWTPQLHKRFVDAVSHLGIKHAVPKTIMQLMSVDGLTRENVASHLQKYRLYLKRMQGISSGTAGAHASVSHADEKLFASGPIPHHFLAQRPLGPGGPEQFMPFAPIPSSLQQQQQQMAAAAAHQQQQFYNHRHMGSIGSSLDHGGFFGRQQQQLGIQRMGRPVGVGLVPPLPGTNFIEDSDSGAGGGGRKILALFPDD